MKRRRPGSTIRRMMAATAAVVALALIALGIQRLSMAVASYRQRAALHRQQAALRAEEAERDRAARDRAITIAAREYERIHGTPPPSAATVAPGQIAHIIARPEADGKGYLVRFGYQHVVNDKRVTSSASAISMS